ncbi:MAG: DUF1905 domain-containing protein [Alphaproteobacteria bacterium]|nr:DUF1905 domain-containing protein [Alphaproteobacteria bacterium]
MRFDSEYDFRTKVWVHASEKGTWYLVTLPKKQASLIKTNTPKTNKRGWGSIPVVASIGKTTWGTSIFPSKKDESYVMLLKADVREKEGIKKGSMVHITLTITVDL